MALLPPSVATWRYCRGQRSLRTEVKTVEYSVKSIVEEDVMSSEVVNDGEVPTEVETVLEQILC